MSEQLDNIARSYDKSVPYALLLMNEVRSRGPDSAPATLDR